MNQQDILQQLRDIHKPDPVGWFPMAIGWWILCGLFVLAILATLWFIRRHARAHAFRKEALRQIDASQSEYAQSKDGIALAFQISKTLRRVCLYKVPRQLAAARTGDDFALMLQEISKNKDAARVLGAFLASSLYTKEPSVDATQLLDAARKWLGGVAC